LWGHDLYALLDDVYRKRARFTIVFVSRFYASKPWTQHERQSAQARALTNIGPYLLPVRLDDSELPGLRPTVGYVDARKTSVDRIVSLIEQKLSSAPGIATAQQPILRSPRTPEQTRELLAQRPEDWEFLLYAGVLWQKRQELEPKWRDHELGYARPTGEHLDDQDALQVLGEITKDISTCITNLMKMVSPRAQERAFGSLRQPGNPSLIEHIATRYIEVYEEMIDLAARLRGIGVSDNMAPVMEAAAHLTDTPLGQIRDFVDRTIVETDSIPDRLASGEPIRITLTLTITVDDEAGRNAERELNRAQRQLGR
jgi:TIR domain